MRKTLALMLIAALLITALPTFAQGGPTVDIESVTDPTCVPGESPTVVYSMALPEGNVSSWTIENLTAGGSDQQSGSTGPLVVNSQSFTIPVAVPAGTSTGDTLRITVEINQINAVGIGTGEVGLTGLQGVGASDFIDYTCDQEPTESDAVPVPGCDVLVNIPSTSVVGQFKKLALGHWKPMVEAGTNPPILFEPGWTAWVIGVNDTGDYTKILWVCQFLWVETGTIGTNPDAVWNDTPLPVIVVD